MSQRGATSNQQPFGGFYRGKRVWVTGHTGFKGSWLCAWLVEMGAEVTGYALQPPSKPAHFDELGLKKRLKDVRADIRDCARVKKEVAKARPEIVFHLAAQPIVRSSYDDPVTTFQTNVMGTVHVLQALRQQKGVRAAVIITSDKCYENVEQEAGYHEKDRLGGKDPYSASKAGAEAAFSSFVRSYFAADGPAIVSARAGNVIGGGDWAKDRIVPDCIRAWCRGQAPLVRNPQSTRPWQHVLEPISGYLALGASLAKDGGFQSKLRGESFNFGPRAEVNETVGALIGELRKHWPGAKQARVEKVRNRPEAGLLKLDCGKVWKRLGWTAALNFAETAAFTAGWYFRFLRGKEAAWQLTSGQIEEYVRKARLTNLAWAN